MYLNFRKIGKLYKNIVLAILLNLTIKPINLLLENIVQDRIGHEQYGLFAALNAFSFLFIVLLDLGINQYVTKKFATHGNIQSGQLASYFSIKLALSFLYPFLMVLLGYLIGYRHNEIQLLFLISLSYSLLQLIMYLRAKFQASQFFTIDSIASISDKSLLILLTSLLLLFGISLNLYVEARLITMVVAFVLVLIPAIKLYSFKAFSFNWNRQTWKNIVRKTYPFALITVLFSIHDKIDQVMIERMLGDRASGLYAGAYRWLDAFMMFLWIVLPMFFARFAFYKNNKQDLSKILTMSQIITGIPIIFVSGFVWFYGEQLFFLLGHSTASEIEEMTLCLKVLFIAVFIHGFFACLGTLLSATGGEHYMNKMLIISIVANIVLNVILLPKMGIMGAAIATVCSNLFVSISYLLYLVKKRDIVIVFSIYLKLALISAITLVSFYTCIVFAIEWWFASIITGMLILLGGALLKLHTHVYKM